MSSPTVNAVCPGCKETLRIPTAWADKAVKCKKCGSVVRASSPIPQSEPAPRPAEPLAPPAAPVADSTPPTSPGYPAAPAYGAVPPGYPAAPQGYPYAPAPGYGVPPGYPAAAPAPGYGLPPGYPPGYGVPPGYPAPAPAPGYGYAAPAGYPYPAAPGYAAPPAPGYTAPPAGEPFASGFENDPFDTGTRRRHRDDEDEDDDRPARRRKYKRSSGTPKWVVLGLFALILIGGGVFAYLKWDTVSVALGMKPRVPKEKGGEGGPGETNTPAANPAGQPTLSANPTFSRRMLVLSSTRYLYCNPLTDGVTMSAQADPKKPPVAQSELSNLSRRIASLLKVPTDKDNNQLYVMTDGGGTLDSSTAVSRPMIRSILEPTLVEFCKTSRPQDRIVIYFGGHACVKEGKGYLIAADGDMEEPDGEGMIPLETFWATLAACPAQQKVVFFDVCRLNEDGDVVRPGSDPMKKELEDLLHAPPKGVEVVTACSEGQTAREFRRAPDRLTPPGSVFLHALRESLKSGKVIPTGAKPEDPIPVQEWVATAQEKIKERFGAAAQTLKFTAGEKATPVPDEPGSPPPARFAFLPAPKGADVKEVKAVFDALALAPIKIDEDTREDNGANGSLAEVVFFPADALADYKTDMTMEEALKAGEKYPVRAAAAKAIKLIRDKWAKDKGSSVQTRFTGEASDAVKKEIKEKQTPLAALDDDLKTISEELEEAKKMMDKEESKYWKAMFLYAYAQTKARIAFVNEYNLSLGRILTDSLPEFNKSAGLQLVSVEKMESKKDIKEVANEAKATFDQLIKESKGTPWAVLAKQYRVVALGLKWQEYKPPVAADKSRDD